MIGASGLSDDDDGKPDGLKWETIGNQSASGITFLPVFRYRHFQNSRVDRRIRIRTIQIKELDEGGPKSNLAFREVQQYTSDIQRRSGEIFSPGKDIFRTKNFLLLMTLAWVSTLEE